MQRIIAIIAGVMLLIAMLSLPYSYYQINRVVVFFAGAYLAYSAYQLKKMNWTWILGISAIVFNPFIPLRLTTGTWVILDFVVGVIFLASVSIFKEIHQHNQQ
jgi:hypothetical protein